MKYVCQICGYVYDEANEKVPFSQLPDDWKCPLCGAAKKDFKAEGSEEAKKATASEILSEEQTELKNDVHGLTVGQLAALCSNLARGCEKQYKEQEAELFGQLADYFTSVTPAVDDSTVNKLAAVLQEDIDNYAVVRSAADADKDRGAARVCVWGEKVTRMLSSLVNRYLEEGEKMLADTEIWICTVCGFVYIGEEPPKLCPVCKVPDWKFEKVEAR